MKEQDLIEVGKRVMAIKTINMVSCLINECMKDKNDNVVEVSFLTGAMTIGTRILAELEKELKGTKINNSLSEFVSSDELNEWEAN